MFSWISMFSFIHSNFYHITNIPQLLKLLLYNVFWGKQQQQTNRLGQSTVKVQPSHLPLLEGVSGHVSPAGGLEQSNVCSGLNVPLLLQPRKSSCSEEHLQEKRVESWAKVMQWQMITWIQLWIFVTYGKKKLVTFNSFLAKQQNQYRSPVTKQV